MKFLVLGLGSMGRRRIRNLYKLGIYSTDIFGCDIREDRVLDAKKEYNIKTFKNPDDIVQEMDVLIISTPPDQHLECLKYAVKYDKHFFCESGIFGDEVEEVMRKAKKKKLLAFSSHTLLFYTEWAKIKELVLSEYAGKPLSFNFHNGNFLPNWHSYESISDFYVTKRKMGGAREIVAWELQWMRWIFGEVQKVCCIKGKLSPDFEADIDDTYHLIYVFEKDVYANVVIDVVARPSVTLFELTCNRGIIYYDYYNSFDRNLKVIRDSEKKWESIVLDKRIPEKGYLVGSEKPYIKEMKCFLDYIKFGKKPVFEFKDELAAVKILEAAERSAKEGKFISV